MYTPSKGEVRVPVELSTARTQEQAFVVPRLAILYLTQNVGPYILCPWTSIWSTWVPNESNGTVCKQAHKHSPTNKSGFGYMNGWREGDKHTHPKNIKLLFNTLRENGIGIDEPMIRENQQKLVTDETG